MIIERGGPFALLFLNNNLHAVHHDRPSVPWYRIPETLPARTGPLPRAHRRLSLSLLLGRVPSLSRRSQGAGTLAAGKPAGVTARAVPARSLPCRCTTIRRCAGLPTRSGGPCPSALAERGEAAPVRSTGRRRLRLGLAGAGPRPVADLRLSLCHPAARPRPAGSDARLSCGQDVTVPATARSSWSAPTTRPRALADLRGRRVALNADDSQSGRNALRAAVAPLAHDGRFFGGSILTGRIAHPPRRSSRRCGSVRDRLRDAGRCCAATSQSAPKACVRSAGPHRHLDCH